MSRASRTIIMSPTITSNDDPTPESAALLPAGAAQVKKGISSDTNKAKRIQFLRNGNLYDPGVTIPVSRQRYRSFDSMCDEVTRALKKTVAIPGAIRNIYTRDGKKIADLEELVDGASYVCCCNGERFKICQYNSFSEPQNKRKSKSPRASLPLRNGKGRGDGGRAAGNICIEAKPEVNSDNLACVQPHLIILIRNGARPRSIMRLLLNKRNSPSFDQVLVAITDVVHLDTGCVRKVFTLSRQPVEELADFFGDDDVFLVYGTERVNYDVDFILDMEEDKAVRKLCKYYVSESKLPEQIRERYLIGRVLGQGGFGLVVKIEDRETGLPYALKIINKSQYKGKKHYLEAELRISKILRLPNIVSLIFDLDHRGKRYFVLEYVGGGDLEDAMIREGTFSEKQCCIIIEQLASAMTYLHSLSIIHRDIKPANLLLELDGSNNIINVKLCDFSLACEAKAPIISGCGTPAYMAPEMVLKKGYGLKVDVWSAGIVLYALFVGVEPFVPDNTDIETMYDAFITGVYEYPKDVAISSGARDLIDKMLQCEPDNRISSEDILTHYWIKSYSGNCNDSI